MAATDRFRFYVNRQGAGSPGAHACSVSSPSAPSSFLPLLHFVRGRWGRWEQRQGGEKGRPAGLLESHLYFEPALLHAGASGVGRASPGVPGLQAPEIDLHMLLPPSRSRLLSHLLLVPLSIRQPGFSRGTKETTLHLKRCYYYYYY